MIIMLMRLVIVLLVLTMSLSYYIPSSSYLKNVNRRTNLRMTVLPISREEMRILSPKKVSTSQWVSYWGVSPTERLQKVMESLLIAYGGSWMAWFFSFMAGGAISAFLGVGLIFNWMYSPILNAKKRNSRLWPPNQKLSYALFTGRIISLNRIRRRAGKAIGAVSQEFLVAIIKDEKGRELEMITQWKESYERLRKQMKIETIIASPAKDFSMLTMVTDAWVPSCDVWIGDYPYLKKEIFMEFTSSIMNKNIVNDSDNNDRNQYDNDYDNYNNYDEDNYDADSIKWVQDPSPPNSSSSSRTKDRLPSPQRRY